MTSSNCDNRQRSPFHSQSRAPAAQTNSLMDQVLTLDAQRRELLTEVEQLKKQRPSDMEPGQVALTAKQGRVFRVGSRMP